MKREIGFMTLIVNFNGTSLFSKKRRYSNFIDMHRNQTCYIIMGQGTKMG